MTSKQADIADKIRRWEAGEPCKLYIHRGRSYSVNGISCWGLSWLYKMLGWGL